MDYIAVEGPDRERMVASLRAELPLHTAASLAETGSQGIDAFIKALRILGIQCKDQPVDAVVRDEAAETLDILRDRIERATTPR